MSRGSHLERVHEVEQQGAVRRRAEGGGRVEGAALVPSPVTRFTGSLKGGATSVSDAVRIASHRSPCLRRC